MIAAINGAIESGGALGGALAGRTGAGTTGAGCGAGATFAGVRPNSFVNQPLAEGFCSLVMSLSADWAG
jgi:hypothetical protein